VRGQSARYGGVIGQVYKPMATACCYIQPTADGCKVDIDSYSCLSVVQSPVI